MKKITIIQTGIIILLLTASITGCTTEEQVIIDIANWITALSGGA